MAIPATDAQVQRFVDERIRPRCEQIRALLISMQDDIAQIDDVYAALTANPITWKDGRVETPHTVTSDDVLAINAFLHNAVAAFNGDVQLPIVRKACVRPVQ